MVLKHIQGFTLLEMLVVMVVIGIILSIATLSIGTGGPAKTVAQEAQRLATVLTLASQQAIIQAEEIGISFNSQGYRFYQLQGQTWQLLQEDIFHPYSFPVGISVKLLLEGSSITLTKNCQSSACTPDLLLLSSGEITPFELTIFPLANKTLTYQIVGQATGKITTHAHDTF